MRPSGDRVKTDAREAAHLAQLLALGQMTVVTVPDAETEAARDLVRAREDGRGELMIARHRVVPSAAAPGHRLLRREDVDPTKHEVWLRTQRFRQAGVAAELRRGLGHHARPAEDRRDRLERRSRRLAADSAYTPVMTG